MQKRFLNSWSSTVVLLKPELSATSLIDSDRAVDVGFVCLAAVLTAMAVSSYLNLHPVAEESRREVFPGGSELPAAYPRSTSSGQLLLAFRSDCGFCIKSVPFYTKLAAYCQRVGVDFRVLTLESPEVVRGILVTDRVRHLDVVRMPQFEFGGTPAIVLVDAQNRVVASWLGWLSPKLEQKVINAIEGLARR